MISFFIKLLLLTILLTALFDPNLFFRKKYPTTIQTTIPLSKQAIVITGASSGIGNRTAFYLGELGYTVYSGYRKEADGIKMNILAKEMNVNVIPVKLDITDTQDMIALCDILDTFVEDGGYLVGLVNNAGIGAINTLEFSDLDLHHWLFDVNVFGAVEMTRMMLPYKTKSRQNCEYRIYIV